MTAQTPKEYIVDLKSCLKSEFEKVHNLKLQSILERKHETAEEFREIERRLLGFITSVDTIRVTA